MNRETRIFGLGTSLTQTYPWGIYHAGRAMCSDGRVRALTRISPTADTFFSVPSAVQVRGKTVSGYVTVETADGYATYVNETDPTVVKFVAYIYGKNGDLLPPGKWNRKDTTDA